MKTRVKVDSAILSFIIILTAFLIQFPFLYSQDVLIDDALDFLGLIFVLKGTYLRMAARGFKKAHSQSGHGLVMTGPYSLVRNPMYLGSFLMGAGFIFIVWPWWTIPIFGYLFYLRFSKQIAMEEKHLDGLFGKDYEDYKRKVPALIPGFKSALTIRAAEVFPLEYVWTTKEKGGLIGWPALAVLLEIFQERIVFGIVDLKRILFVFALAITVFIIAKGLEYRRG